LRFQRAARAAGGRQAANWTIIEVLEDHGISGAKGRDKRSAFDAMLKVLTARMGDLTGWAARLRILLASSRNRRRWAATCKTGTGTMQRILA
jgi:hypothetical protein